MEKIEKQYRKNLGGTWVKIIIPYRLKSKRFPNKYLKHFIGKSLIEHSIILSQNLGDVILTSPEEDYIDEVSKLKLKYDFEFIPTPLKCRSATDRAIEISKKIHDDYYVIIPVDEPLIKRSEFERVLSSNLDDFNMYYTDFFNEEDCISELSAKVIFTKDKYLLYMSRNVIPVLKNGMFDYKKCKKAVGIKVYSKFGIQQLYDKKTELDLIEGLEELKLVELGYKVKMHKIRHIGFGIDIPEQIKLLEDRYYEN